MLTIGQNESTGLQPGTHERSEAQVPGEFPPPIGLELERDGGTVRSFTLATSAQQTVARR